MARQVDHRPGTPMPSRAMSTNRTVAIPRVIRTDSPPSLWNCGRLDRSYTSAQSTRRITPTSLPCTDVLVVLWLVSLVGGWRTAPGLLEEPLQGHGVLLDLGHDDVTVPCAFCCGRMTTRSPSRMGVHHRVPAHAKDIRIRAAADELRDGDALGRVLIASIGPPAAISRRSGAPAWWSRRAASGRRPRRPPQARPRA